MKKYTFNKSEFDLLMAGKAKDERLTIAEFAATRNRKRETVSRAIKSSEYAEDVFAKFPMMRKKTQEAKRRTLKSKQTGVGGGRDSIYFLAATMPWRKAA